MRHLWEALWANAVGDKTLQPTIEQRVQFCHNSPSQEWKGSNFWFSVFESQD